MTSTEFASNHRSSSQSVFKDYININQNKQDSKPPSRYQSFYNPKPLNNLIINSNISNKNILYPKYFNSLNSNKSEQDSELCPWLPSFLEFSMKEMTPQKSNFQSKFSNFNGLGGKKFKLEPQNLLLNFVPPEIVKEKEKIINENLYESNNEKNMINNNQITLKNNIIIKDNNYLNYNEKSKLDKNMDLNLSFSTINNMGTKFFTNHNYGYKCSCSKTQCNRKYCECYNSGNYCTDCNCKNCKNQPPINTYSNKHPSEIVSKMKKSKEVCTCTKSGCNKNYCQCFKSGNKCTSLCRCIGCENTEDNIKLNKNFYYECCRANSIYILNNEIYIENVKIQNYNNQKRDINILESYETNNETMVNKKRKREENIYCEEFNIKNMKKKIKDDYLNDSLFDENGKVILRHINTLQ